MQEILIGNYALKENEYDTRDYEMNHVLKKWTKDFPKKYIWDINATIMQWAIWMCTAMWTTHAMLMQNIQEFWKWISMDKYDLWIKMGHDPKNVKDSWDNFEDAVKTAYKEWIKWTKDWKEFLFRADWYAYAKWSEDFKYRVSRFPLIVAMYWNKNTRAETLAWEIKTIGKFYEWHIVCARWYDDGYVYFANSFSDALKKGWVSQFKISIVNFLKAIQLWMFNWRYMVLFDKKEVNMDVINQKKEEEKKRKLRLKELLIEAITLTNDKKFIEDCKLKIDFINKSLSIT